MRPDTGALTQDDPTGDPIVATWSSAELPAAAVERLRAHVRLVALQPGDVLLREGGPADDLGVVGDGRLAIRLRVPGRGETTILTVERGDIVGWSALVPPHRSTSTVVAMVATTMLLIDGPALRAELEADPATAAPVYRALLGAMSRRLTGTRLQLLDLFTTSGTEPW
jgi:CRP/FNR family cyclic AMP-dependent transcriptional regulator